MTLILFWLTAGFIGRCLLKHGMVLEFGSGSWDRGCKIASSIFIIGGPFALCFVVFITRGYCFKTKRGLLK
jgi:hypothetical protein